MNTYSCICRNIFPNCNITTLKQHKETLSKQISQKTQIKHIFVLKKQKQGLQKLRRICDIEKSLGATSRSQVYFVRVLFLSQFVVNTGHSESSPWKISRHAQRQAAILSIALTKYRQITHGSCFFFVFSLLFLRAMHMSSGNGVDKQ